MMRLNTLRWHLEVLAWRHGLWGVAGVLLAAAALLLWLCWLPAQEAGLAQARLAERLSQVSQAGQGGQGGQVRRVAPVGQSGPGGQSRQDGQGGHGGHGGQVGQGGEIGQGKHVGGAARVGRAGLEPAARLPQAEQAADGVARLLALAAEQGLQPLQADYRRDETGGVGRWQVQMPVTGAYPQLRRYLRAAQAIPGLSVDALGLHRGSGAAPVEARLSFSIWYAVAPAGEVRP